MSTDTKRSANDGPENTSSRNIKDKQLWSWNLSALSEHYTLKNKTDNNKYFYEDKTIGRTPRRYSFASHTWIGLNSYEENSN